MEIIPYDWMGFTQLPIEVNNLAPCPLCGRKPYYHNTFYVGVRLYHITCECGLSLTKDFPLEERWNTRAERTCRIITTRADSDYVDDWRYRCSECLCNIPVDERIRATGEIISAANYCPSCGAKVMK